MGSSDERFYRPRTVHQILGGGHVADIVLWRDRNVTMGILMSALAIWVVFERCGYTLLSLTSSVLLLLMSILFVWSKTASILNRPAPPLPEMYLSEEIVAEMGEFARTHINAFVTVCKNVALGKDSRLFIRVGVCLLLLSTVGGLTDMASLCYICLVLLLTVPALYERFEDQIDRCLIFVHTRSRKIYIKLGKLIIMLRKLDLEKIE